MRHLVPFVGEQNIVRANDEQARAKRIAGRVIDEVVGDGKVESSWDDVVSTSWIDKSKPKPAVAIANTASPKARVPLKALHAGASVTPVKKTAATKTVSSSSAITFSDSASMDWEPINNGRGLRISVYGNIDKDLRRDWGRLLSDTEAVEIHEFEFNLTETSELSLTGLGLLLLFKERKGPVCDVIKLCNCNKDVARLLYWAGMDKYFVIETTKISDVH